jgi:hypothetical protein
MMKKRDKFRSTQFQRPRATVPVPALAEWLFEDGEKPDFLVRGLTTNEVFTAREAISKTSPLKILAEAAQSRETSALADAFKLIMGGSRDAVSQLTAFRIELMVVGVIDTEGGSILDYEDVIKMAEHFPSEFLITSEKINELSAQPSLVVGEK